MSFTDTDADPTRLRLWPGVVLVALQWGLWYGGPVALDGSPGIFASFFGALLGGVAVLFWWLFLSRAPRLERWGGVALIVVALVATRPLLHESISTLAMGVMFFVYALPFVCLALVAWAVTTRGLAAQPRRAALLGSIVVVCGAWTLLRADGVWGSNGTQFTWRWTATAEERLLARGESAPAAIPAAVTTETAVDWPGFRGSDRDSIVRGVRIDTDWSTSPPAEMWRRPVGPGWSSFAVGGGVLYTQEQRGEEELVSAYSVATGEAVWRHADQARFWEAMGGAGPRGTPALHAGRVYTFGATGILNALDAGTGSLVWSRNAATDVGAATPGWGFASSPLVVDERVVVAVAGQLAAFDLATGAPLWAAERQPGSYASPHLMTLDGVAQIALMTGAGIRSVSPDDGTLLWEHRWPGFHSLQPSITGDGLLIANANDAAGIGTRRLSIAHERDGWSVQERWTTARLKPYFNDFVVHEGHAYGFDGSILACIDMETGERSWKGGRFGNGQLVLLPDQDLLLVLSEHGELGLVRAVPDAFTELARVEAIQGKTWNHPVLVGDVLLVRNDEEMAAFRLSLAQ